MRSLAQQFRDRQRFQRWACIVGLVSQPFCFWSVWVSGQWGVGVVAVVCALAWLKGLWIHWLAPRPTSGLSILQLPPESRLKQVDDVLEPGAEGEKGTPSVDDIAS